MHDTHIPRALHISSCIMKKIQVTTNTINDNMPALQYTIAKRSEI